MAAKIDRVVNLRVVCWVILVIFAIGIPVMISYVRFFVIDKDVESYRKLGGKTFKVVAESISKKGKEVLDKADLVDYIIGMPDLKKPSFLNHLDSSALDLEWQVETRIYQTLALHGRTPLYVIIKIPYHLEPIAPDTGTYPDVNTRHLAKTFNKIGATFTAQIRYRSLGEFISENYIGEIFYLMCEILLGLIIAWIVAYKIQKSLFLQIEKRWKKTHKPHWVLYNRTSLKEVLKELTDHDEVIVIKRWVENHVYIKK
jgi:hypothetical protein